MQELKFFLKKWKIYNINLNKTIFLRSLDWIFGGLKKINKQILKFLIKKVFFFFFNYIRLPGYETCALLENYFQWKVDWVQFFLSNVKYDFELMQVMN